jgi:TolB-like protein/Flp pilus assembly protein TadD
MEEFHPARGAVRFGVFEADLHAGELRKQGVKIKLQKQPFQILQMLLECPGEIVTRENLHKRIWPPNTFVDFDQGLHSAVKRLREALSDSAENPRFVETIPGHGYRFIADIGSAAPGKIQSLAVLPLENLSRDPEQEYFVDGLTEALINNLAKISALRVTSRTTVMHYKGTHQPLSEIARELRVDGVVEGTVIRSGERVRISVQLINAHTDTHVWADSYDRDLRDILALQSEVARAIAGEVRVKVSPQEQTQLAQTRTVDPQAYEAYLKGRYHWNKRTGEAMKQGLECFRKAIEVDSTYAAAHAGVADSAAVLGWWGFASAEHSFVRAKEAARTALSIDATLAEAHASLGFSLMHYDFDFPAAGAALRRALEINPRYATGAQWYGILLYSTGRFEEGLAELKRAIQLDPLSLIVGWTYAHFLFFAGRYDDAIEEGRKILALHPNSGQGRQVQGIAWAAKGAHDTAIGELTEARLSGCNPNYLGSLGFGYAAAGQWENALGVAKELQGLFPTPYPIAYWMAMIYANLEEKDEAFRWLEKAYAERGAQMVYLAIDRRFDKLRPDPHFQDLLRRMNFPS